MDAKRLWVLGLFVGSAGAAGSFHRNGATAGPLPGWVIPLIVVGVVIAVVAFFVNVVSEPALIDSVRMATTGARRGSGPPSAAAPGASAASSASRP